MFFCFPLFLENGVKNQLKTSYSRLVQARETSQSDTKTEEGDNALQLRHENIHPVKYKCNICSKQFPNHSKLERHKRLHSGERPYECDVCHAKFTQKSHLKNHQIMIHFNLIKSDICITKCQFSKAVTLLTKG